MQIVPTPQAPQAHHAALDGARYGLLLTATIDPGIYGTQSKRSNPLERLADYEAALGFWGNLDDSRVGSVVFCENSGWDLRCFGALADRARIPIELLSLDHNDRPAGMHYGYSELGLIDHALARSALLQTHPYFIKVTGRLTFPSISRLLDSLPIRFDAVVDHRRRYRHEWGVDTRARTQLMVFRSDFYRRHLLGTREEMIGNCTYIEEFLAQKLAARAGDGVVVRRFPVECAPRGIGGNGTRFDTFPALCKNVSRGIARRLMPTLWL